MIAEPESAAPEGDAAPRPTTVLIVTGMSGAGRTTALHALEDLGFFCTDNLPTALAPAAVDACVAGGFTRIALGIDVRVGASIADAAVTLDALASDRSRLVRVLFLDATDEALLRRFSETRRPHPLARSSASGALSVLEGVTVERTHLAPLRARAAHVIDTTRLSVHELRRAIIDQFGPQSATTERMRVQLMSFGFKYGVPVDADVVLDVRFLDNPYFVEGLGHLAGTDAPVREFVRALSDFEPYLAHAAGLLDFVLPRHEAEGKSYLTVAIGCTGGRHRSVVVAEELARRIRWPARVVHRDVDASSSRRGGASVPPPPRVPRIAKGEGES